MTTKATAAASLAGVGLAPRGLTREQAAAYVGLSQNKFDDLVRDGAMPRPKCAGSRRLWDVRALDTAFDALPDDRGTGRVGAGTDATGDDDGDVWSRARV
jgi:excisionase family DNA binding protein